MNESKKDKLTQVVAKAQRDRVLREQSYREQALKMYPPICGRCGRAFSGANLRELTVHHRDHDHDNNPPDGSNWELLCLYCHDNEHQRQLEAQRGAAGPGKQPTRSATTFQPFAQLKALLDKKDKSLE